MFKSIKNWISEHRKAVIITATILSITGTVVVLLINGKKVKIPIEKITENIIPEEPTSTTTTTQPVTVEIDGIIKTFPRESFIRHLHEGWKASPVQIAKAQALNIELEPGETFVSGCTVNMRKSA